MPLRPRMPLSIAALACLLAAQACAQPPANLSASDAENLKRALEESEQAVRRAEQSRDPNALFEALRGAYYRVDSWGAEKETKQYERRMLEVGRQYYQVLQPQWQYETLQLAHRAGQITWQQCVDAWQALAQACLARGDTYNAALVLRMLATEAISAHDDEFALKTALQSLALHRAGGRDGAALGGLAPTLSAACEALGRPDLAHFFFLEAVRNVAPAYSPWLLLQRPQWHVEALPVIEWYIQADRGHADDLTYPSKHRATIPASLTVNLTLAGIAYLQLDRRAGAEADFVEALRWAARVPQNHDLDLWRALSLARLGSLHADQGKLPQAEQELEEALTLLRKASR